MSGDALFQFEDLGDVVVVTPARSMGEFEMAKEDVPAFDVLKQKSDGHHLVIDLHQTDYFGSSTIGLFISLVNHVHGQGRRIAFCNLSEHEREVVNLTNMNKIWDVKPSLEQALEFVRGHKSSESENRT